MKTEEWSVYRVHYVAVKADGRVKVGDSNFFEASTIPEIHDKLDVRGLDPANVTVTRTDYKQQVSEPVEVKL
jgi:hypothetical protein